MDGLVVSKPLLGYVRAELIVNCVIVFLMLTVVTLRVAGRITGPGLGWDDGLIMFCAPLGVGMLICQGLLDPTGNGYSLTAFPELAANIPYILKLTFGMQIIYVLLLASVKASMLCFFLRVFVTTWMQRAAKITLGFVVFWMVSYLCACIFLCDPISGQWTGVGKCGAYIPMIQSLIATNAAGDLVIMALPMRVIWTLQTRKTDKIGITISFALGLACVVCAVFRLIYISTVDLNSNVTGTMPTTIFLFILEPNLAVLCVSIPMLRPWYVMYKKRMGGSRLDELSDDRTGSYNKRSAYARGTRSDESRTDELNKWEMEDYTNKNKAMVTAYGDDSGSEKNLTGPSSSTLCRDNVIGVERKWTVTRSAV
ncbi:hypothetical protein F4780DRAFT_326935 [Xylariomycetidae sp. FL0641]|nr:hypothetical protein F4780DRAFT_326935 [Xylariomycetidae sp. FL0641]